MTTPRKTDESNIVFNHIKAYNHEDLSKHELFISCKKYIELLTPYCGPFAKYGCIITNPIGSQYEIDTFTKDGITLLKSTRPETFVDMMLQRILATVGERVDMTAHDGTTTAMLLLVSIVSEYVKQVDSVNKSKNEDYTAINAVIDNTDESIDVNFDNFEDAFDEILRIIQKNTLTVDTLHEELKEFDITHKQLTYAIAFNTAMISSKGNRPLSTAIAYYVCNIPKELYTGSWSISHSQFEQDTKYEVVPAEADLFLTGVSYRTDKRDFLNDEAETIGNYRDCDMIFLNSGLTGEPSDFILALLNTEVTQNVIKGMTIEQYSDMIARLRHQYGIPMDYVQSKPLVVFTTSKDNMNLATLAEIFMDTTGIPVIIVQYINTMMPHILNLYTDAIYASAGKIPFNHIENKREHSFENSIIHGIDISLCGSTCSISNISIKSEDESEIYHPFFKEKEKHRFYNMVLNDIATIEKREQSAHKNKVLYENEKPVFADLKHLMIAKQRFTLKYYGHVHQVVADKSVIDDALGAVMSSLIDGFVVGGYLHILNELKKRQTPTLPQKAVMNALQKVLTTVYSNVKILNSRSVVSKINSDEYIKDLKSTTSLLIKSTPVFRNQFYIEKTDFVDNLVNDKDDLSLIQPSKGFMSQFHRYKDLIVKLINTEDFIDARIQQEQK